jgi:hypothetical protein
MVQAQGHYPILTNTLDCELERSVAPDPLTRLFPKISTRSQASMSCTFKSAVSGTVVQSRSAVKYAMHCLAQHLSRSGQHIDHKACSAGPSRQKSAGPALLPYVPARCVGKGLRHRERQCAAKTFTSWVYLIRAAAAQSIGHWFTLSSRDQRESVVSCRMLLHLAVRHWQQAA